MTYVMSYHDMWSTPHRGLILIHASSQPSPRDHWDYAHRICRQLGIALPDRRDLDHGGIVGMADLADVVTHSDSPWWIGPYGFVLSDATPLDFQRLPGKLHLFDVAA